MNGRRAGYWLLVAVVISSLTGCNTLSKNCTSTCEAKPSKWRWGKKKQTCHCHCQCQCGGCGQMEWQPCEPAMSCPPMYPAEMPVQSYPVQTQPLPLPVPAPPADRDPAYEQPELTPPPPAKSESARR